MAKEKEGKREELKVKEIGSKGKAERDNQESIYKKS